MPIVLILVALIGGYLVWRMSRPTQIGGPGPQGQVTARGKCRWVATGNDTAALGEYYCKTCKVTAYAQGGKPPKECKKSLRGSL